MKGFWEREHGRRNDDLEPVATYAVCSHVFPCGSLVFPVGWAGGDGYHGGVLCHLSGMVRLFVLAYVAIVALMAGTLAVDSYELI